MEVAIWENRSQDGDVYHSVSLTRSYSVTDRETGEKEYKQTNHLRSQDVLLAAELLRLAFYKIRALEGKDE